MAAASKKTRVRRFRPARARQPSQIGIRLMAVPISGCIATRITGGRTTAALSAKAPRPTYTRRYSAKMRAMTSRRKIFTNSEGCPPRKARPIQLRAPLRDRPRASKRANTTIRRPRA